MNTVDLIQQSIEHWERMMLAGETFQESACVGDCALCREYYTLYTETECCAGCPIAEFTGEPHCRGTPYIVIARTKPSEFKQFAKLEVDFLKNVKIWAENL